MSPLQRARRTAELAGLSDLVVDPDLQEWDYGGYEGLTTPQIREQTDAGWTVFRDGVVPGETPGESLDQATAKRVAYLIGPDGKVKHVWPKATPATFADEVLKEL